MPELTVNAPADPAVCDRSVRVDSPLLVTTPASTPMLAELMASASPEIVWSESLDMSNCCAVRFPTWIDKVPLRVSVAFLIASRYPLGLCRLRLLMSCCCSKEVVGDPNSGCGFPDESLPSCALMALITAL